MFAYRFCYVVSLHVFVYSESRFKEKHSLDSDEEDTVDEVQLKGLDDEDLAAQEESTVVSGKIQVWRRLEAAMQCTVFMFTKPSNVSCNCALIIDYRLMMGTSR